MIHDNMSDEISAAVLDYVTILNSYDPLTSIVFAFLQIPLTTSIYLPLPNKQKIINLHSVKIISWKIKNGVFHWVFSLG
jgi:hypothetical protein